MIFNFSLIVVRSNCSLQYKLLKLSNMYIMIIKYRENKRSHTDTMEEKQNINILQSICTKIHIHIQILIKNKKLVNNCNCRNNSTVCVCIKTKIIAYMKYNHNNKIYKTLLYNIILSFICFGSQSNLYTDMIV